MRSWSPALAVFAAVIVLLTASSRPAVARAGGKRLSTYDAQIQPLLARMTLGEKIGQMTQPDQSFLAEEKDIETYFLGSLLSGGDSDPKTNSLQDWTQMYDRYQSRALTTRLRIPLLYGVDAVHGHNNVLGAVIFPHNVGLGAARFTSSDGCRPIGTPSISTAIGAARATSPPRISSPFSFSIRCTMALKPPTRAVPR